MSRKFLTNIDLNSNELRNGIIHNLATDPTGKAGQLYYNTVDNELKYYDGGASAWVSLSSVDAEVIEDAVAELLAAGSGISLDYNDAGGSLTIANTGVTSVSGTANEVLVSASAGSVTIGLPDSITADVTGDLTGNADTASTLETARAISLGGSLSGSVSFDGSQNVTITADIVADSVALGTDTTGDYVAGASASGAGISVTGSGGEGSSLVIANTGVTSISGTANEIDVSASAGAVTLSLPSTIEGSSIVGSQYGRNIVDVNTMSTLQLKGGNYGVDIKSATDGSTYKTWNFGTDGNLTAPGNIVFEGSSEDDYETTLSITNPTADRTITVPNASGTIALFDDNGSLTVPGNLTISGSVTTLNTETLLVEDNQITLNSNVTGAPATNAGIEVERGDSTNASLIWNESSDKWSAGLLGSETAISLEGHTHSTSDVTGLQEYVEDTVGTMLTDSSTVDFTYTDNGGSAGTFTAGVITASTSYLTTASGLAVDISSVESKLVTDGFTKKFSEQNSLLTPSSGVCTWTVTHNLGTKAVTVQVYEVAADYNQVEVDVQHTSTSAITIKMNSSSNIAANSYEVVVVG